MTTTRGVNKKKTMAAPKKKATPNKKKATKKKDRTTMATIDTIMFYVGGWGVL